MASQFTNPFTNPGGFFSTQPGGFFAAPQGGRTLTGLISDPRMNIGLAIAQGQPIGRAILGGALQAQQVRKALTPEDKERKIVKGADGRQRYVDTGELVFPDVQPTPEKLSDRETRLQDIMTELGVDRATAIKYDKGLITQGTTEAGKPALIDIAQNTITPLQNITSQLNDSASIGVQGEQEIENVIPQFIVSKPQISMELVTKGERDNATELATSSEIALSALNEMNSILARDPRLAGIVGMGVRFGKGAIESLSDIVGERNLKYLPEGFDAGLLTDPDVERLAILEDQFVAASADIRAKKGDRAPNIKDYTEERNRLNLTGFTGGKGAQQRINEIAREVNVKSMQYQSFRGGFQPNLYSDMVKDYSLDPNFNAAFGTSVNTQTGIVTKRFKASDVLK